MVKWNGSKFIGFLVQRLAVLIQTLKNYFRAFRGITLHIVSYYTFKK